MDDGGAGVTAAGAASEAPLTLPTKAEIEGRIKDTEAATGLEDGAKNALLEQYHRALANLELAHTYQTKSDEFLKSLESAPEETARIRSAPEEEASAGPSDDSIPEGPEAR